MATTEFCVTLYPYNGDGQDEALTFNAGEKIVVVEKPDDGGWWKGEKPGGSIRGWFPASYVKVQTSSPRIGRATINLPSDWEVYQSPEGRPYYVNKSTRETRWDLPIGSEKLDLPSPTIQDDTSLPDPPEENQNGSVPSMSPADFTPPPSPLDSPAPEQPAPPKETVKPVKQRQFIINNITFPHPNALRDQSLLKPDECSYCDYFWPDRDDQSGFSILVDKHHLGKTLSKEMAEFLKERAAIEDTYAKNLQKLSLSQLGAREEGTLSLAWKRIKHSLSEEAEIHQQFAAKLREELEKPLMAYKDSLKKEIKKMEQQMTDERKQLASKMQVIDKGKQKLDEKRKDMEFKQTSPQASKADVEKAKKKTIQAGEDLNKAVDVYNTMQDQWFQDMITLTLELEKMELNRINMVKKHYDKYHQLRNERDTQSQKILQSVQNVIDQIDANKDSEDYVKTHTTGSLRPVHLELS
ncbi:growth arrest-specific protein 7-like [Ptychodera flava]|uniref:growth arrest-specific protein 7-like n=1 Tax=Ptychodera flava TaxID=63121 RepID=UPI00396A606F